MGGNIRIVLWLCAHSCVMLCALVFPRHLIRLGAEQCLFGESLTERSEQAQGLETRLLPLSPPSFVSVSLHTYICTSPSHSSVIPFLRPRASQCPAATKGLPKQHTAFQPESQQSVRVCLLREMICGWGDAGTHLLMAFHHCCALLAAWHACVSINHA